MVSLVAHIEAEKKGPDHPINLGLKWKNHRLGGAAGR